MNLRCIYCQTPFTLGRMEKLSAIQKLQAENLHHYDAFCPRCRRSTPISIQRLEIFTPGWQEGLQTLEADATTAEKARAVEPTSVVLTKAAEAAPSEHSKKRHASKSAQASAKSAKASKTKPAPAKKSAAKPAAKKSAAKPAAKKSTAKTTSKPKAKSKSK